MLNYLHERGIRSRSIAQVCRSTRARHVKVRTLNSPRALAALRLASTDLIVYAGGGILRRDCLAMPRLGVLNAHGGPLPRFRGMNSAEWALFFGAQPTVSVHYMDTGIDTGPVFFQVPIPLETISTIPDLRGVATRIGVEAILKTIDDLTRGPVDPIPQEKEEGRQFFVMADHLLEVVEQWFADGRTPSNNDRFGPVLR